MASCVSSFAHKDSQPLHRPRQSGQETPYRVFQLAMLANSCQHWPGMPQPPRSPEVGLANADELAMLHRPFPRTGLDKTIVFRRKEVGTAGIVRTSLSPSLSPFGTAPTHHCQCCSSQPPDSLSLLFWRLAALTDCTMSRVTALLQVSEPRPCSALTPPRNQCLGRDAVSTKSCLL